MIRDWFTIADVAQETGLRPWTIRRLEAQGRLPSPRRDPISGKRVYSARDLESLRLALAELMQSAHA